MAGTTIARVAIVAILVLWLSGPRVPGWLVVLAVAAAVPMAFSAGSKQKRMERRFVRAGWRRLTKRT